MTVYNSYQLSKMLKFFNDRYASMLNSVGKEQTIWEEFRDELQLPIDEILIKMDEYVRDIHQVRSNNIHNIYYGKLFLTQR